VQAFGHTPALAALTFPQTMLLVAASIGGSLVQLPVIGWFTQIAAMALTLHVVLNVPIEPATACGAVLLSATFLFLIPVGLLCAYLNGVTLTSTLRLSGRGGR
jgi:glycosyltransferase 2 family protein